MALKFSELPPGNALAIEMMASRVFEAISAAPDDRGLSYCKLLTAVGCRPPHPTLSTLVAQAIQLLLFDSVIDMGPGPTFYLVEKK